MNVKWDNWMLQKIYDKKLFNLYDSLESIDKYIELYPLDYKGYISKVNILIDLNKLDEAQALLNELNPSLYIFGSCLKGRTDDSRTIFLDEYYKSLVRLNIYQYKYHEAYDFLDKCILFAKAANATYAGVVYYLKKNLGINEEEVFEDGFSYLRRQIKDYSSDRFLEHIKKHQESGKNIYSPMFNKDFNISEIVKELKKIIPNDKHYNRNVFIFNNYIFKYDNCGKDKTGDISFFEVITLKDSNQLITMYPTKYGDNYEYIDLNYLNEKKNNKVRVRRKSQIDKFYEKYGK